jgi:hypothetical protein
LIWMVDHETRWQVRGDFLHLLKMGMVRHASSYTICEHGALLLMCSPSTPLLVDLTMLCRQLQLQL